MSEGTVTAPNMPGPGSGATRLRCNTAVADAPAAFGTRKNVKRNAPELRFDMRVMKALLLLTVASSFLACSDRLGPEGVAGRYELMSINDERLPIDKGPLFTRDARPTGCRFVLDEGFLELVAEGRLFILSYQHEDSCDGDVLSKVEQEGTYSLESGRLVLSQSFPNAIPEPLEREFTGDVIADTIWVLFYEDMLRFER